MDSGKLKRERNYVWLWLLAPFAVLAFLVGLVLHPVTWTYNKQTEENWEYLKRRGMPMLERIREVTAYTIGRKEETDGTPCIGPNPKIDLCALVRSGVVVYATRAYPQGTWLIIGGIKGIVLDKTSSKYGHRIDVAMLDRNSAINFGIKNLPVEIVK